MSTRRVAGAVIVLTLVATTACGDDDDRVGSGAGSTLSVDDGDDERCEALRAFAEAEPSADEYEADELEAAYEEYADAAERAAEASEGADRQLLTEFAELMRTMASDLAGDVTDEVERLADPMWDFASRARRECDVSFG